MDFNMQPLYVVIAFLAAAGTGVAFLLRKDRLYDLVEAQRQALSDLASRVEALEEVFTTPGTGITEVPPPETPAETPEVPKKPRKPRKSRRANIRASQFEFGDHIETPSGETVQPWSWTKALNVFVDALIPDEETMERVSKDRAMISQIGTTKVWRKGSSSRKNALYFASFPNWCCTPGLTNAGKSRALQNLLDALSEASGNVTGRTLALKRIGGKRLWTVRGKAVAKPPAEKPKAPAKKAKAKKPRKDQFGFLTHGTVIKTPVDTYTVGRPASDTVHAVMKSLIGQKELLDAARSGKAIGAKGPFLWIEGDVKARLGQRGKLRQQLPVPGFVKLCRVKNHSRPNEERFMHNFLALVGHRIDKAEDGEWKITKIAKVA